MLKKNKAREKPINVLFIINALSIGGNETSALALAKNIDKNLFDPKILVLTRDSSEMEHDFKSNNIELIYMHSNFSNPGSFCLEFYKILRKYKIRSLMSYVFSYKIVLIQIVSVLANVRHRILRISGSPEDKKLMKKLFFIQLVARFLFTREVVVSNAVRSWISRIGGFPMSRVSVIYNGIAHESRSDNSDLYQRKTFQIIMIARMDEAKDQYTLITAMSEVQKKIPRATLVLAGDGSNRAMLELYSKEVGCKTTFLGYRKDVSSLLNSSTIFVLSTKTEGFPNALLEAMAHGLPVIASDIPPCLEILNSGSSGLLFGIGDTVELSSLIIDLLENPKKRSLFADQAKIRSKDFDMINMVNEYQTVLSGFSIRS